MGVTETATGLNATETVIFVLGSDTLAAVMVAVCEEPTSAGAEYSPVAEIDPLEADHVTPGVVAPVTLAANCCVCPDISERPVLGVTDMVIG